MGSFPNKDTQFKKGQVANPNGRPKWKSAEELFEEFLAEEYTKSGVTKTRHEWLRERVFHDAMGGNTRAQALIYERRFGKAKQTIAHEGEINLGVNRAGVVERFLERNKDKK